MYYEHFDFTKPLLWVVDGLLEGGRCRELIARVEREGAWLEATVNSATGRVRHEQLRDNDLAMVRDEALHAELAGRLRGHVPEVLKERALVGLTRSLRVYRYRPGQHFGLHRDQSYEEEGAVSRLTFILYLNDDFEGGETDFPEVSQVVTPVTGSALLFQHMLLHQGCRVKAGTKYLLRADVLYTAEPTG